VLIQVRNIAHEMALPGKNPPAVAILPHPTG